MLGNDSEESTQKNQNENPSTNGTEGDIKAQGIGCSYEELKRNIGLDWGTGDLNEPYIPLPGIIEKSGINRKYALILLQYHGYRNCDGIWSDQMLSTGYVVLSSYIATEESRGIKKRFKKELLSPEAQELFLAFFAEANLE